MILQNRIDFAVIIAVENANPNGDPLNGNRPRQNIDGFGEMSDVCIKRKVRNRLQSIGKEILLKSNDIADDGLMSTQARVESYKPLLDVIKQKKPDINVAKKIACDKWADVRFFGQVFALKTKEAASFSVRGPVSIRHARSLKYINIEELMMSQSANAIENTYQRDSSTLGRKWVVSQACYVTYGTIFPQLAESVGFTEGDAEDLKYALTTLFEEDASSARPAGSMSVEAVYWWKHNSKMGQYSPARVHRTLKLSPTEVWPYYAAELEELPGLIPEVISGYYSR